MVRVDPEFMPKHNQPNYEIQKFQSINSDFNRECGSTSTSYFFSVLSVNIVSLIELIFSFKNRGSQTSVFRVQNTTCIKI